MNLALPLNFDPGPRGMLVTSSPALSSPSSYLVHHTYKQPLPATSLDRFEELVGRLMEAYADFASPNWGGNGELALKPASLQDAAQFLFLLPTHMREVDFIGEPNGTLAIEWRTGQYRSLIVSFAGNRKVTYSQLAGPTSFSSGMFSLQDAVPISLARLILETIEN